MVSILCCQSLCVIDSCSVSPFFSFFLCHPCGLNLVFSLTLCHLFLFFVCPFSSLILSHLCGLNLVLSVFLCHWFLNPFFSFFVCHLGGLNLVLSVILCYWFLFCLGFFPHSFSVTFVGSILCCQSLCVIEYCSVNPFSWLIRCHLGGLNLVLSNIFCHWLLFCESFFLIIFLSPLWVLVLCVLFSHPFSVILVVSILCCQSLCVIDYCSVRQSIFLIIFCLLCVVSHSLSLIFVFLSFSSLIFCHLCGLKLVLSVVLCHWLLLCESFFSHSFSVTFVVSISCVVSGSLSLIFVLFSVIFPH